MYYLIINGRNQISSRKRNIDTETSVNKFLPYIDKTGGIEMLSERNMTKREMKRAQ